MLLFMMEIYDIDGEFVDFFFQRLMLTTKPILKRHQLRQGEDLSKVILDESGSFDPDAPSLEGVQARDEPLLANSVELQKMENLRNGTNSV